MKYEVIWDVEDDVFGGVYSLRHECETMEEALRNVAVIVDEWIETADMLGRDIPAPKGKLAYA